MKEYNKQWLLNEMNYHIKWHNHYRERGRFDISARHTKIIDIYKELLKTIPSV